MDRKIPHGNVTPGTKSNYTFVTSGTEESPFCLHRAILRLLIYTPKIANDLLDGIHASWRALSPDSQSRCLVLLLLLLLLNKIKLSRAILSNKRHPITGERNNQRGYNSVCTRYLLWKKINWNMKLYNEGKLKTKTNCRFRKVRSKEVGSRYYVLRQTRRNKNESSV